MRCDECEMHYKCKTMGKDYQGEEHCKKRDPLKIENDAGVVNLAIAIVQNACDDYFFYRRAYYTYGDLSMRSKELTYPSGYKHTVHYFDLIPPYPKLRKAKDAKDRQQKLNKWCINFYSKLSRIVRYGRDAEQFLSGKDGDLEMMMEHIDGKYLMRELDVMAREAARTGKRRTNETLSEFLKGE